MYAVWKYAFLDNIKKQFYICMITYI